MTSEDLLNQVLAAHERGEAAIGDPHLRRRIELHLSGLASNAADAEVRDFDERVLDGVAVSEGDDPLTVNVHMTRGNCKGAREVRPVASVSFVSDGTTYDLVAFPYESLRKLARFMLETCDSYEEWDDANAKGEPLP